LRRDDLDQSAHHIRRGVELACLLTGGIGKVFDQIFVGGAEQVGELEVLVAQRDLLEILDKVGEGVVIEGALTDLLVEVDPLEHVLQGIDVGVLQFFEGLVQRRADVGLEMADRRPVRRHRDKEGVFVRVGKLTGNDRLGHPLCFQIFRKRLPLLIKKIGETFQKEHAKDIFLVFRGIHIAAKIVAGAEQKAGKLRQGKFLRHEITHLEMLWVPSIMAV
jgi:hypothetical protein